MWSLLKNWLNHLEIRDVRMAQQICWWIPARCPFEREIRFRGRLLFKIPALCQLNPLYPELMALRWRALCFLAEQAGQDVSCYCH
ncbi:MAG: Mo-dependent nitrogenase C-terminal domain-containing protein [Gloeomargarita sp. GMQP_bins_120]